jgi:hypothetical protein
MTVILRHAMSGYCYGGGRLWLSGPKDALDLETIERAVETARAEDFGGTEVVACFGDPDCELVLPVKRKEKSGGETAPARSKGDARPPP